MMIVDWVEHREIIFTQSIHGDVYDIRCCLHRVTLYQCHLFLFLSFYVLHGNLCTVGYPVHGKFSTVLP